jgi:hypothetical protein
LSFSQWENRAAVRSRFLPLTNKKQIVQKSDKRLQQKPVIKHVDDP